VTVASCHLYDGNEFNRSFVKYLMPGVSAVLVNISFRPQGFYVRRGNPKQVTGWQDLGRSDISVINRPESSSARILLDVQIKKMGLRADRIKGYDRVMNSHLTIAAAVAEGEADIAVGTERVSHQMDGIDFIPLLEERYDLVIRRDAMETPMIQTMIKILRSEAFKKEISHFSGNDYRMLGTIIDEV